MRCVTPTVWLAAVLVGAGCPSGCRSFPSNESLSLMIPQDYAEQVPLDIDGNLATYYSFSAKAPAKLSFTGPLKLLVHLRPSVRDAASEITIMTRRDNEPPQAQSIRVVPSKIARYVGHPNFPGTPGEKQELRMSFDEGEHSIALSLSPDSADTVCVRFFEE